MGSSLDDVPQSTMSGHRIAELVYDVIDDVIIKWRKVDSRPWQISSNPFTPNFARSTSEVCMNDTFSKNGIASVSCSKRKLQLSSLAS